MNWGRYNDSHERRSEGRGERVKQSDKGIRAGSVLSVYVSSIGQISAFRVFVVLIFCLPRRFRA